MWEPTVRLLPDQSRGFCPGDVERPFPTPTSFVDRAVLGADFSKGVWAIAVSFAFLLRDPLFG